MKRAVIIVLSLILVFFVSMYIMGHKSKDELTEGAYYKAQVLLCNEVTDLFGQVSTTYVDYLTYKKSESEFMKDLPLFIEKYNELEEKGQDLNKAFSSIMKTNKKAVQVDQYSKEIRNCLGELLLKSLNKDKTPVKKDTLFKTIYDAKKNLKKNVDNFKTEISGV